jgi:hypothetical protein
MPGKLLAATATTILALVISISTTQAQTNNTPQKKLDPILNANTVKGSTGTAGGYKGTYNYPPKKPGLDQGHVPSPPTTKNPNGGWRGPTNQNPVHPSTTTYHAAPVTSTTTYHAPVAPPSKPATPAKKP